MDHSHPHPLPGQNVLSMVQTRRSSAAETRPAGLGEGEKCSSARAKRVRPHLDDKVLASWNGLMLGAMARAWVVLGNETYRAAAERNLALSRRNSGSRGRTGGRRGHTPGWRLYHRWRDGVRDTVQLLGGYAFLLSGVIELYEATLETRHLDFALALADAMLARFYDSENGGFWQPSPEAQDLVLRLKEDYDGPNPRETPSPSWPC